MARTFTEAEAQRVFARVAERQRAQAPADGGLTLEDLEDAARAAGLDPSLVASAAAEVDAPAPPRGLLGAPTETARRRLVRGRVSDEAWEAMVAAARAEFGRTGTAGLVGRTREWTAATGGGNAQAVTRLALEPVGDDTRVVVTRSSQDVAVGFTIAGAVTSVMAVVFTALAAAGVDPELWIPAAIMTAMGVLFLGGSQIGLRVWHRRQEGRVDALLDRLELVARDAAPAATAAPLVTAAPLAGGPGTAGGRVDPGLLDDEAPDTPGAGAPRRTRT
ncbi:MAG TPA: hypothetical protein VF576_11490 [Rubricoccaceae bacterium]